MNAELPRKIYRYVHVTDDGMAPCIDGGLLTLATCKPKIRRAAREGDWVLGFYPSPAPNGVLGWAGRVADRKDHGRYERDYRGRSDAVYREGADGQMGRLRADYHMGSAEIRKDLSAPVLIFDPDATWYFGDNPAQLPEPLNHLAAYGQGHRVNFREPGDYSMMLKWLASIAPPGFYGGPRHAPGCAPCGQPKRRMCSNC